MSRPSRAQRAMSCALTALSALLIACGGANDSANRRDDGTARDAAITQAVKERDIETDLYALDLPDDWQQIGFEDVLTASGTSAEELGEAVRGNGASVDTSGLKGSVTLVPPGVDVGRQSIDQDPDPQVLYTVVQLGKGLTAAARPAAASTTAEELATALEAAFGPGIERRPSSTSLDGAPTVIVGDRELIAAHDGRLFSLKATSTYLIPERRLEAVGRDLRMLAKGWSWK